MYIYICIHIISFIKLQYTKCSHPRRTVVPEAIEILWSGSNTPLVGFETNTRRLHTDTQFCRISAIHLATHIKFKPLWWWCWDYCGEASKALLSGFRWFGPFINDRTIAQAVKTLPPPIDHVLRGDSVLCNFGVANPSSYAHEDWLELVSMNSPQIVSC